MDIEIREFIGWERLAVDSVAEKLLEMNVRERCSSLVIIPTQESGRALRERMAEMCEGGAVLMPRIRLVTQLQEHDESVADAAETEAIWVEVLRTSAPDQRWSKLFPAVQEWEDRRAEWRRSVARRLMKIRADLAEANRTPEEVVAELKKDGAPWDPEASDRWLQLCDLFRCVDEATEAYGKKPANTRTEPTLPPGTKQVILAGLPQVSPSTRILLRRMIEEGVRVRVWVRAPQDQAEHFDAFGEPLSSYWQTCVIDIPDDNLHVTVDEYAMAAKALDCAAEERQRIGGSESNYTSREISLGSCDARFTPALIAEFSRHGLCVLDPAGRRAAGTAPVLLVQQLLEATRKPDRAEPFLTLLRNPILMSIAGLRDSTRFLGILDWITRTLYPDSKENLYNCFKKQEILVDFNCPFRNAEDFIPYIESVEQAVQDAITGKFAELAERLGEHLEARDDATPYGKMLRRVGECYQRVACLIKAHPGLNSAEEGAGLLQDALSSVPASSTEREKTMMSASGWLELIFSPGNHLILTGLHDGCVPEASSPCAYLPDSLREQMGMDCRARRTARDSYLLTLLLNSHRRTDIIIARQLSTGDLVSASSLLIRCPDRILPSRVSKLFREIEASRLMPAFERGEWFIRDLSAVPEEKRTLVDANHPNPWNSGGTQSKSRPFSPSTLGNFLYNPLAFWLRELYGLDTGKVFDDTDSELRSNDAGTILHSILEIIGKKFRKASTHTEEEIREACMELLDASHRRIFGDTVFINRTRQYKNMQKVLSCFSSIYHKDLQAGWITYDTEFQANFSLPDPETGDSYDFSMRIDRLDYHPVEKRFRVIDYKTGKTAAPNEKHLKDIRKDQYLYHRYLPGFTPLSIKNNNNEILCAWTNLQLPLYAEYVKCDIDEAQHALPEVAYMNLDTEKGTAEMKSWEGYGEELHASAMLWTRLAARHLRNGTCLISSEMLSESKSTFYTGRISTSLRDLAPDGLRRLLNITDN